MHLGLALSFLMHAGLLAWAYFTMSATPALPSNLPEPIAVSLITPSEFSRLKQGDTSATELEAKAKETEPKPDISKKEAEKPKPITGPEIPAPAPEPTPPAPAEPSKAEPAKEEPPKADPIAEKLAALPEPTPGPSPEELKKIEDQKKAEEEAQKKAEEDKKKTEDEKKKAEEKKKADEKKKAEEARKKKLAEDKKKAEEKKKKDYQAFIDKQSAMLDKDPTKRGAPQASSDPSKPTDYTGPTAGADRGTDTVLSVTQQQLLLAQINQQLVPCSKMPGGGGGIDTPRVVLKWKVNPDGSMASDPVVLNPQATPLFQIAADASINAVRKCSPLNLPPDMYAHWSTIEWEFDWPKILGLR